MEIIKLKEQLQVEVDTAFLYSSIAAIQTDDNLKKVLNALSEIETGHAKHMFDEINKNVSNWVKFLVMDQSSVICQI